MMATNFLFLLLAGIALQHFCKAETQLGPVSTNVRREYDAFLWGYIESAKEFLNSTQQALSKKWYKNPNMEATDAEINILLPDIGRVESLRDGEEKHSGIMQLTHSVMQFEANNMRRTKNDTALGELTNQGRREMRDKFNRDLRAFMPKFEEAVQRYVNGLSQDEKDSHRDLIQWFDSFKSTQGVKIDKPEEFVEKFPNL